MEEAKAHRGKQMTPSQTYRPGSDQSRVSQLRHGPVHSRMFSSIPGLYTLDADSYPRPPSVTTQSACQHGQAPPARTDNPEKAQDWKGWDVLPRQCFLKCGSGAAASVRNVNFLDPVLDLDQRLWGWAQEPVF